MPPQHQAQVNWQQQPPPPRTQRPPQYQQPPPMQPAFARVRPLREVPIVATIGATAIAAAAKGNPGCATAMLRGWRSESFQTQAAETADVSRTLETIASSNLSTCHNKQLYEMALRRPTVRSRSSSADRSRFQRWEAKSNVAPPAAAAGGRLLDLGSARNADEARRLF